MNYAPIFLDRFPGDLRYSLPLQIGFDAFEVNHGRQLSGTGPPVIAEANPSPDACLALRAGLPCALIDAFTLQGPPEALDEDVVQGSALAVHRDKGSDLLPTVGPGDGCDLRPLIRIHDFGRADLVDRLVRRLQTDACLQRIRDAQGQHLAGGAVHDCVQMEEPTAHGQAGDARAPDLIGPLHL